MDIQVMHGPANAAAKVILSAGETITAEGGSMIAMSGDMSIETSTRQRGSGGISRALKRMLSGESFFLNHYRAGTAGGEIWLAPTLSGDIFPYEIKDEELIVQSTSWLAGEPSVELDLGWQGFKSLFAGEGLFWIHLKGRGKVALSSFGAIYPIDVDGSHIVDSGHIVAFEKSLEFKLTKAGKSWISSFLGGEGLVCRFEGKGRVWCQSHNPSSFGHALTPHLKQR